MNAIQKYITHIVQQQGGTTQFELLRRWSDIMGNLHKQTRLESFADGYLVVGVYDPQWMQELYMLSSEIKRHINTHFQSDVVHYIRFKRVARRTKRAVQPQKRSHQGCPGKDELTSQQRQVLDAITDTELRNALYAFYTNSE